MQTHHHHPLPQAGSLQNMSIEGLMDTTLRLSDLMMEESAMLKEQRVKDLPALHEEKLKLAETLEIYQRRLETDPTFTANADEKMREELLMLADDLAFNVEENFRQVSTARAVNQRIMQAIMDAVSVEHRPSTYGRNGQSAMAGDMALSMNLNQRA